MRFLGRVLTASGVAALLAMASPGLAGAREKTLAPGDSLDEAVAWVAEAPDSENTLTLAPGDYPFSGAKVTYNLTIAVSGDGSATIDGGIGGSAPLFTVDDDGATLKLTGVALKGGSGALAVNAGAALLDHCRISGARNEALTSSENATIEIRNSKVEKNNVPQAVPADSYVAAALSGTVKITNSSFSFNGGTGLTAIGDVEISGSTFEGNKNDGLVLRKADATVTDSLARGNAGSGIVGDGNDETEFTIRLVHVRVADNQWDGVGLRNGINAALCSDSLTGNGNFGLRVHRDVMTYVASTLIAENWKDGVHITGAQPSVTFINNTVAYNKGYGVTTQSPTVFVRNSIVWNNSGVDVNADFSEPDQMAGGPEVSDSIVRSTNVKNQFVIRIWDADPKFEWVAKGDYRLKNTSPGLGAGANGSWKPGACDPEDLGALPRILGPRIDLGAAEYMDPAVKRACGYAADLNACYVKETLALKPF